MTRRWHNNEYLTDRVAEYGKARQALICLIGTVKRNANGDAGKLRVENKHSLVTAIVIQCALKTRFDYINQASVK